MAGLALACGAVVSGSLHALALPQAGESRATGGAERDALGPESTSRACGRAPESCDLVVVIDDAASLASTAAGRGSLRVLEDVGLFTGTSVAWAELASALGMTPDAALQAMAGSRTMLMATRETVERPTGWALLTEVSGQTERLIRERLKPVPRQIVDGQPVLMLENGRILLATRRGTKGRGTEVVATVLIAPADATALFEACLPMLSGNRSARALGDDARVGSVLVDGASDAFVLYRGRESEEPGANRSLVAVSAWGTERGWRATIACDSRVLGEPDDVAGSAIPGSLFDAVSRAVAGGAGDGKAFGGAVIAFGAPVSDARDKGSAFSKFFFRLLSDIAPNFHGAGLVAIREREAGVSGGVATDLILCASVKGDPGVAATLDAGMASLVNRMSRGEGGVTEAQDFAGRFPGAVREATMSARGLSVLASMIGAAPVIRWCGTGMDGQSLDDAPRWWLAGISDGAMPSDAGMLRSVAASLAPDAESLNAREPLAQASGDDVWTTIGLVRPSRALQISPPVLATLLRPFRALRFVRTISWRGALGDAGLVRGEAALEFEPDVIGPLHPGD
jgi:hypothetical protein